MESVYTQQSSGSNGRLTIINKQSHAVNPIKKQSEHKAFHRRLHKRMLTLLSFRFLLFFFPSFWWPRCHPSIANDTRLYLMERVADKGYCSTSLLYYGHGTRAVLTASYTACASVSIGRERIECSARAALSLSLTLFYRTSELACV